MRANATALLRLALLLAALAAGAPARADDEQREPLEVVTTLAYLADVARAVGGEEVHVTALAPPGQDPHFVVPSPARSVALRDADVLIETGLQLELWSERVIDGARNARVRPGAPGHLYAAIGLRPLQVPRQQTRAAGDVHVGGNPHVWLDPLNLKAIARNVERTLAKVRPAQAEAFAHNRAAFEAKVDAAFYGERLLGILGPGLLDKLQRSGRLVPFLREKKLAGEPLTAQAGGWLKRALALEGLPIVSYHQVWTYFAHAFGLEVVGTIEEKPGIPPSPAHLEALEQAARSAGARVVTCAPFYPLSRAEGVAERIGGVAVALPTQPGEEDAADVFAMFDLIFTRLEEARERTREPAEPR